MSKSLSQQGINDVLIVFNFFFLILNQYLHFFLLLLV